MVSNSYKVKQFWVLFQVLRKIFDEKEVQKIIQYRLKFLESWEKKDEECFVCENLKKAKDDSKIVGKDVQQFWTEMHPVVFENYENFGEKLGVSDILERVRAEYSGGNYRVFEKGGTDLYVVPTGGMEEFPWFCDETCVKLHN